MFPFPLLNQAIHNSARDGDGSPVWSLHTWGPLSSRWLACPSKDEMEWVGERWGLALDRLNFESRHLHYLLWWSGVNSFHLFKSKFPQVKSGNWDSTCNKKKKEREREKETKENHKIRRHFKYSSKESPRNLKLSLHYRLTEEGHTYIHVKLFILLLLVFV